MKKSILEKLLKRFADDGAPFFDILVLMMYTVVYAQMTARPLKCRVKPSQIGCGAIFTKKRHSVPC
ncbi:MAG: hypothetical protein H7240_06970 [Glaciimonas sp.]|nr:hypothetical protein [Glaciimonas sp.]